MTISASVIADSISASGVRLTTFKLRYPRFIHAEFMTHRTFSRNASSSRAIPVAKMIEDLRRDPAMPVHWGSNQPGMQAGEEVNASLKSSCESQWLKSMEDCIRSAQMMYTLGGLHKQIANRILEPWAHINVVCTATDYANFYALRRHKDAQPEIKVLADAMWDAQQDSTPFGLAPGEWHLPYIDWKPAYNRLKSDSQDWMAAEDQITGHGVLRVVPQEEQVIEILKKVSVARCARVSYLTHDGRPTSVEEDIALYNRLLGSSPLHASPAEHQATPDTTTGDTWTLFDHEFQHGNLTGWRQLRKMLPNEFVPG